MPLRSPNSQDGVETRILRGRNPIPGLQIAFILFILNIDVRTPSVTDLTGCPTGVKCRGAEEFSLSRSRPPTGP